METRASRGVCSPTVWANVRVAVLAALLCAVFGASAAWAANVHSDYLNALRAFKTLGADKKAAQARQNWTALDGRFVAVYRAEPDGPVAPKALFYRGWVYEELGARSFLKKDYQDAAELYLRMADRFPGHDWADDALYRRAEILLARLGDKSAARETLTRQLSAYPGGDKAPDARTLLASFDPQNPLTRAPAPPPAPPASPAQAVAPAAVSASPAASVAQPETAPAAVAVSGGQPDLQPAVQTVFSATAPPAPPAPKPASPGNPATLEAVETSVDNGHVRVSLVLDRETTYHYKLLGKEKKGEGLIRLYIDLENARLGPKVPGDMKTPDNVIRRIRSAYNRPGVVRVVVDMEDHGAHSVFSLDSPFRVVLDLTGTRPVSTVAEAPPKPAPEPRPAPQKPSGKAQDAAKEPDLFSSWVKNLFDTDKSKGEAAAPSRSNVRPSIPKPSAPVLAETEKPSAPEKAAAPAAPAAKAEEYSPPPGSKKRLGDLIEQLGLTVRNIMIDPGHGGKDPGAQGAYGTVEKDINLKFAKILGKKLAEHGFNVSYTRTKDVFIPLEKRTEMANEQKADLFISVHCNAHGSESSNGLETYSLNLAQTEDAVRVAARENAISAKQISDLQLILTDLMLSAKMKESKDLAKTVQSGAIRNVKRMGVKDRGPHEAPFYVLMGAKMPAILVELGYITNKAEAKRLGSDKYLDALAQGLVNGVIAYKKQIERFASIAKPRA